MSLISKIFGGNNEQKAQAAYEKGNYDEAIRYFEKSANGGNTESMVQLGEIFHYKRRNLSKSLEWFHKAAERGSGEACFNIGYIYQCEEGFEDYATAAKWYKKALALGYAPAKNPLIILEANGYA